MSWMHWWNPNSNRSTTGVLAYDELSSQKAPEDHPVSSSVPGIDSFQPDVSVAQPKGCYSKLDLKNLLIQAYKCWNFMGATNEEVFIMKAFADVSKGNMADILGLAGRNREEIERKREDVSAEKARIKAVKDEFCITDRCYESNEADVKESLFLIDSFEDRVRQMEGSQTAIAELFYKTSVKQLHAEELPNYLLERIKGEFYEDLGLKDKATVIYQRSYEAASAAGNEPQMYDSYIRYLSAQPEEMSQGVITRTSQLSGILEQKLAVTKQISENPFVPNTWLPDATPYRELYAETLELKARHIAENAKRDSVQLQKVEEEIRKYASHRIGGLPSSREASALIRAMEATNGPYIVAAAEAGRKRAKKEVDNIHFERALKTGVAEELYKSVSEEARDEGVDTAFASYLFNTHLELLRAGGFPLDGIYTTWHRAVEKYRDNPAIAELADELKEKAPHLFKNDAIMPKEEARDAADADKAEELELSLHLSPGSLGENLGIGSATSLAGASIGAELGLACGPGAIICSPLLASGGSAIGLLGGDQIVNDLHADEVNDHTSQARKAGAVFARVSSEEALAAELTYMEGLFTGTVAAGALGPFGIVQKTPLKWLGRGKFWAWAGRFSERGVRHAVFDLPKNIYYHAQGFLGFRSSKLINEVGAKILVEYPAEASACSGHYADIFRKLTGKTIEQAREGAGLKSFLMELPGRVTTDLAMSFDVVDRFGMTVIADTGQVNPAALNRAYADIVREVFKRTTGCDITAVTKKELGKILTELGPEKKQEIWFSVRAAKRLGIDVIDEKGFVADKELFEQTVKPWRKELYNKIKDRMAPWREELRGPGVNTRWVGFKDALRKDIVEEIFSARQLLGGLEEVVEAASATGGAFEKYIITPIVRPLARSLEKPLSWINSGLHQANRPLNRIESEVAGQYAPRTEQAHYMAGRFAGEIAKSSKMTLLTKEAFRGKWLREKGKELVDEAMEGVIRQEVTGHPVKPPNGKFAELLAGLSGKIKELGGKLKGPAKAASIHFKGLGKWLNAHVLTKELEEANRWLVIPAAVDFLFYDPDEGFVLGDGKFDTWWGFWSFVGSSCYASTRLGMNNTFGGINAAAVKALTFITFMGKASDEWPNIDYESLKGSHLEYLSLAPLNMALSSGLHYVRGFSLGRMLAAVPVLRSIPSMTNFAWAFEAGSTFLKPSYIGLAGRALNLSYYVLIIGWGTGYIFASDDLINTDPIYKLQRAIKNAIVGIHIQPLQYSLGYLSNLGQFVVRWYGYIWELGLYEFCPVFLNKGKDIPLVTRLLREGTEESSIKINEAFVDNNQSLDLIGVFDRIAKFGEGFESFVPTGFEAHLPRLGWRQEVRGITATWLPMIEGRLTKEEAELRKEGKDTTGKFNRWENSDVTQLAKVFEYWMYKQDGQWLDNAGEQKGMLTEAAICRYYARKAQLGEERYSQFREVVKNYRYRKFWEMIPAAKDEKELVGIIRRIDEKELDYEKAARVLWSINEEVRNEVP